MLGRLTDVLKNKGDNVLFISPDQTVGDAVSLMDEKRIGALLVMEGDSLIGIFTERDVLRRVVAAGREVASTKVGEVMTREIVTVKSSLHIEDAMAVLTEKHCRHLPVVEDGRVEGVVSIGDLTMWVNRDREVQIKQLVDYISGKYPA